MARGFGVCTIHIHACGVVDLHAFIICGVFVKPGAGSGDTMHGTVAAALGISKIKDLLIKVNR